MREYIIVNDKADREPRFLTPQGGETPNESEARRFTQRSEARWALQANGLNRCGWRVVTAPFLLG